MKKTMLVNALLNKEIALLSLIVALN